MLTDRVKTIVLATAISAAALGAIPTAANADFRLGIDEPGMGRIELGPNDWAPLVQPTGASIVRRFVYWSQVAPTRPANPANPNDPAYMSNPRKGGNWAWADNLVRIAKRAGADVMLSMYSAPAWAEGSDRPTTGYGKSGTSAPYPGSWKPDPAALGEFGKALAKRYDGTTPDPLNPDERLPRVKMFEAWNEPNYQMFLSPQCSKGKMVFGNVCSSGGRLLAPANYRLMLNALYDGIKSVQPDAVIAAGGLGPYGNSSQGFEIDPQVFARNLMCLGGTAATPVAMSASACPIKAKLDALSFHPYTLAGTPTTKAASSNGGALGNTPDLRKALDLATSAGTTLPAGPKELWQTETGWMTCPPCRATLSSSQTMGIDAGLAGRYTAEMIYRGWSWGVQKLIWFGLVDYQGWPAGLYNTCAAGATVRFADCSAAKLSDAVAKPALSAFRFPIFSAKASSKTAFSWVLSPCKVPGSNVSFELLNSSTKRWSPLTIPGPIDPKTKKPTSVPLVLTLPTGTDGTAKSDPWAIPTGTSSIRATASGTGCSTETSIAMPIASK